MFETLVDWLFQPWAWAPTTGLVDPAGAALEQPAVLVDEEVVADVVPAVGVAVIAADGQHHRRASSRARSRCRRPCGGRTPSAPARTAARSRGLHCVARIPVGARDDHRRRAGLGGGGRGAPAAATRWVTRTKRSRSPRRRRAPAQLQRVGAARPDRVGAARGGRAVGAVVAGGRERHPAAPAAVDARADAGAPQRAAAAPAQADEVEAPARAAGRRCGRAAPCAAARATAPAGTAIANSATRGSGRRARRGEQREQDRQQAGAEGGTHRHRQHRCTPDGASPGRALQAAVRPRTLVRRRDARLRALVDVLGAEVAQRVEHRRSRASCSRRRCPQADAATA